MTGKSTLQKLLARCAAQSGCSVEIRCDEPMSAHTTFRVGGPADVWVRPLVRSGSDLSPGEGDAAGGGGDFRACAAALFALAREENIPVFILGGGANIVVSDRGIRGLVLDTGGHSGLCGRSGEAGLEFRSGTSVDDAAETAAAAGLGGLEFLAGMPGSIGGAVWMNARCYGREIAGVLTETEVLDYSGAAPPDLPADRSVSPASPPVPFRIPLRAEDFGYKKSPFRTRKQLILSARFALKPRSEEEIRREMAEHRKDREKKGHYRYPSAGSAFKNNREFGKPTGKIIDELGLRGFAVGGAQVAPFHGNIFVNTGTARAAEIYALVREIREKVKVATGFTLEPEILFVGDFD
ncbi:MAG: FAD-binding protein [Treponema sp.]|nr:FAD-binding protein [Treponema sp.]